MARDRRHRSPWLLVGAFAASLVLHPAVLFLIEALRPTPPPKLFVAVSGKGSGTITSQPAGIDCSEGRGKQCASTFKRGKRVELIATVAQGSTFGGWTGGCRVGAWALACTVTLDKSAHVEAEFGLVPKRVNVAWVKLPPVPHAPLDITLPDPKQDAALLDVHRRPKIRPKRRKKREHPQPKKRPKLAMVKPPPPSPVKPKPPPPKPKPKLRRQPPNMKSVEVPDEKHVVAKAPDDARFLSDKNRDVAVETRADKTNLDRPSHGKTAASQKSHIKSAKIGGPQERIAELETTVPSSLNPRRRPPESSHSGKSQKAVGVVRGQGGQNGEGGQNGSGSNSKQPGALSMRGIKGRAPPGGPTAGHAGEGGRPGRAGKRGRVGIKTQLTFDDYQRIIGKQRSKEEVALGRRRLSHHEGRWQRRQDAIRSALENFIPEVRPGNQTALRTRAAPFALYIARMHRRIHPLFAWGFLRELDDKPASFPLNKWSLRTQLEIVINPDGTVDKVTIVRPSGQTMFDVGAIDAVETAAPYGPTPPEIRSANGKVYIHWWFNRDWRECGTFGAHPFILNNPPKERDRGPGGPGSGGTRAAAGGGSRHREADASAAARRAAAAAAARAVANLPTPDDPRAKRVASEWLAGFAHGDVAQMVRVSATPFRSGGRVVAKSAAQLRKVYRTVVSEAGDRRIEAWRLLSPAGYRRLFDVLPAGVDDTVPHLFLVVRFADQKVTLTFSRTGTGDYRIDGLYR